MKCRILILAFTISFLPALGQSTTSLNVCIDSAIANYPSSGLRKVFAEQNDVQIDVIEKSNYPNATLSAKATVQDKVLELPIKIPGMDIPELNPDQYKFAIDIQQSIYKGGITKHQKEIANIDQSIGNAQLDIELNSLKQRVVAIYFQVVLTKKMIEVNESYQNLIDAKIAELTAAYEGGVVLMSSVNQLKAEKLAINQSSIELNIGLATLLNQLNDLTKFKLDTETVFEMPQGSISSDINNRPELKLMTFQQQKLEASKGLFAAKNLPMVYAFTTVGYGRPGLNYLSNEWDSYIIGGVGLSYNIYDWNYSKNQKKLLDLGQENIEFQKKTFVTNLNNTLIQLNSEVEKQNQLLANAQEIMNLRTEIYKTTENQMKNGTTTTSELITQLQNLKKSQVEAEIYSVKLSLAKTNYQWATGNL